MSEDKKPIVDPADSLFPENFTAGGGGWSDNKVRIISAKFVTETWANKDGQVAEGVKPSTQLELKGVALTDDAKERRELISCGAGVEPTPDGEGLCRRGSIKPDKPYGEVIPPNENSNVAKFLAAVHNSGFPMSALKGPKISGLNGAIFTMKAEQKLDKDKKPKVDKKGYAEYAYYPVSYDKGESVQGGGSAAASASAPAAGAASSDETAAAEFLIGLVAEGPIARNKVPAAAKKAGLSQAAIILTIKEDFLKKQGIAVKNGELVLA